MSAADVQALRGDPACVRLSPSPAAWAPEPLTARSLSAGAGPRSVPGALLLSSWPGTRPHGFSLPLLLTAREDVAVGKQGPGPPGPGMEPAPELSIGPQLSRPPSRRLAAHRHTPHADI